MPFDWSSSLVTVEFKITKKGGGGEECIKVTWKLNTNLFLQSFAQVKRVKCQVERDLKAEQTFQKLTVLKSLKLEFKKEQGGPEKQWPLEFSWGESRATPMKVAFQD